MLGRLSSIYYLYVIDILVQSNGSCRGPHKVIGISCKKSLLYFVGNASTWLSFRKTVFPTKHPFVQGYG